MHEQSGLTSPAPDRPVDGTPSLYAGYQSWKRWDSLFSYNEEDAAYFVGESAGLKIGGAAVLEIGFGSGAFLAWARDNRAVVSGTEIIPELKAAAERGGVALLPAAFEEVAEAHADRFDTILAMDVFEHFAIEQVVTRLAACETMLKAGGHLMLRFPNGQSPFGLPPQNGDPTHKSALSRGVFEQLIQGTSFEIVRYAPSYRVGGGGFVRGLGRILRNAARDLIAVALNAIYSQHIPWDPVVVLVMRKR